MPTALPNYLPRGERLLEGTISSGELSAVATSCIVSNPPSSDQLPTYFEFEPDSADNKETVRVTDVSGSTITFERGVYNGGTGKVHASNSAYKQKITSEHWKKVVEAVEAGYLMEDASLALTRDSATQFTITGADHTPFYTQGRYLRFNESDSALGLVVSSVLSGSDTVVTIDSADSIPGTLNSVEIGIQPKNAADKTVLKDATQTLTNKTLTSPKVGTAILDTNGNEIIKTPATTSAVNEVTVTNAATGNAPSISATGDDTNIDIEIKGKGAGGVKIGTGTVAIDDVLDEDTLSSDSATAVPTQQSVKAYVDTAISGVGGGKVLQVVQGEYSTEVNTTNTTLTDTGLEATITPSNASNKILVLVKSGEFKTADANTGIYSAVIRGSTEIAQLSKYICFPTAGLRQYASLNYLDSPATTSATTYKVQFKRQVGSGTVTHCEDGTKAYITLIEIDGT